MEEESFIGAFGDVPTDLAGDYSQLYIFRAEDFGAWYRRVRDAYNREVGSLRDETYVDTMSDADLAEHGLVRIPVDADGEYIKEHDKVDWLDHAGTWHENATVVAVCNDGCYVMDGTVFHVHKSDIRHHHAPTVEDVLREFTDEVWNRCCEGATASDSGIDELVAEYAAKLRLANDGEEQ